MLYSIGLIEFIFFFKSNHEVFFVVTVNPHLILYFLPPNNQNKLKVITQF